MPIYEYICSDCETEFAQLRPMSKVDAPIACSACGSAHTSRKLSLFAAVSRGNGDHAHADSGTSGGCGTCGGGNCGSCHH
jgi:putative FmdB family regulatory protein